MQPSAVKRAVDTEQPALIAQPHGAASVTRQPHREQPSLLRELREQPSLAATYFIVTHLSHIKYCTVGFRRCYYATAVDWLCTTGSPMRPKSIKGC